MLKTFENGKILVKKALISRSFCTRSSPKSPHQQKLPNLIYRPHFIRWCRIKYQLLILSKIWDRSFTEGSFIYGATQAVCKVTNLIARQAKENRDHREFNRTLASYLSESAIQKLHLNLKTMENLQWINIEPSDVKLFIPIDVRLQRLHANRRVSIHVSVLAMKWRTIEKELTLPSTSTPSSFVILALDSIFERNFSQLQASDWTVTSFLISKYYVIRLL